MPESTERKIHPKEAPVEADEHDFFVRIAITRGPRFYEGKRHSTNREIAEVLTEHATHSEGLLREVFSLLAKFHLQADEAVPGPYQNATGAFSNTYTLEIGCCGSCYKNGVPGRAYTVDGNPTGECYACLSGQKPGDCS